MRAKGWPSHGLSGNRAGGRHEYRLSTTVDADTAAVVRDLALGLGVSVAAILRAAIRDYIATHEARRRGAE